MRKLSLFIVFSAIITVPCASLHATAFGQDLRKRDEPGKLSLRLDEPRYNPLSGRDIVNFVSGRMISLDRNYQPLINAEIHSYLVGGCDYEERFYRDGRWTSYICEISIKSFDGTWKVENYRGGQRLCVEADNFEKQCRFVWSGPNHDQLILSGIFPEISKVLVNNFVLYKVSPIG
jgi:hypothetical protein